MNKARPGAQGKGGDVGRALDVDGPVLRLRSREVGQRGAVDDEIEPIAKNLVIEAQARDAHVPAEPGERSGRGRTADRSGRLERRTIGADEAAVPMDEADDTVPTLGEDPAQFGTDEAGGAGDQNPQGSHQQHAAEEGPAAVPPKGRSVPHPAKMP